MMPTELVPVDPEAERRRYKIVRADTLADVEPGSLILSASVETGRGLLRLINNTSLEFDFGPNGLRIVAARE